MTTINRIPMTVTGNTGEITYRTGRDGTTFANFSVAQTARVQNTSTGRWEDGATTWIRCTAAGPLAEHMQQSGMTKGVRVTVAGWYEQRDYQDEKGQRRSTFELRANDVAASLQFATVTISKVQTANGFAGRQTQPAPQQAQQWAGQPTPPAPAPGYQYTDGFANANPQQPVI